MSRIGFFDPYMGDMGVGSALVAAVKHGRRVVGCDRERAYVEIARQRLSDYFNGTLGYRPPGRPVHQLTGREKVSQISEKWKLQIDITEKREEVRWKL